MKIIALQAENIKRLVAVDIRPDGNVVQITGKNGQGKTSVLDAIWWALAGTANIQGAPIRAGQQEAKIRLDLGDIIVTRFFKTQDGKEFTSTITVVNAEGAKFPSPQTMLDQLLGQLSFDPLAFARMKPREQFDALRKFVPDIDFEAIDADDRTDYQRRNEINRRQKDAAAAAKQISFPSDTPDELVDVKKMMDELYAATELNSETTKRAANRTNMKDRARQLRDQAAELFRQAEELDMKIANAPPLPSIIDTSKLHHHVEASVERNRAVESKKRRREMEQEAARLAKESADITARMAERASDKAKKIADATLPIPSLGFGDGMVLLNGVPFEQASDAEQLRASISIAMALNPKLRVLRVRDGSLLDEDSLAMVSKMATDMDYQIWIERVDSSGEVGFVLENGHLKNKEEVNR